MPAPVESEVRALPYGAEEGGEFRYAWEHPRLVEVQLVDDTDRHDDLYFEKERLLSRCERPFDVAGPALFLEDSLGGEGVAFFRQAPLPHARADDSPDWHVDPGRQMLRILSSPYRCFRVGYRGGRAGRVRAATDFHRSFRPYVAGRDGLFLSNTWGDGHQDACVNERFLRGEIAAGAELGVDVIQIDDGWEKARLRMEVLNPERKPELYPEGDPLAPLRWPRDAIFAIAMYSSPLGWFEIQNLSPETVEAWKPLIARWKRERDAIHEGYVYPVGSAPDGLSWTGFVSASRDGTAGTALLFRELDAREEFSLPLADYLSADGLEATVIGGRGEARIEGGVLTVAVRDKLDFVWVKIAPR